MKIAIANDIAMAAEALRRVVASTREHQVVWIARSGLAAVALCAQSRPDLILMDLNMPQLDGVEAIRQIMRQSPCAILVVTGQPQDNVNQVFRALGAGALDVTATPVLLGTSDGAAALLAKIKTIGKLIRHSADANALPAKSDLTMVERKESAVTMLVAIGASTGGPSALAKVLADWTPPPACAIVVVQHIDENFASPFAKWLGDQVQMPVRVIVDGDQLEAGSVLVTKTNHHLILDQNYRLSYDAAPRDDVYRPSVDVFFHCIARHWRANAIGILLTGMGRDGGDGLLAMRRAGKITIAQDQASSAVYGMPRAAAELGAAQMILPLDQIGPIVRCKTGGKTR